MQKTVHAIFEDGVLRPLEPLMLPDGTSVVITVDSMDSDDVRAFFTDAEWEAAKTDSVSLDQVRAALSSIHGSLSETVIALRDDR